MRRCSAGYSWWPINWPAKTAARTASIHHQQRACRRAGSCPPAHIVGGPDGRPDAQAGLRKVMGSLSIWHWLIVLVARNDMILFIIWGKEGGQYRLSRLSELQDWRSVVRQSAQIGGVELAQALWGEKDSGYHVNAFEYQTVHNHFVLNSVSVDGLKYFDQKRHTNVCVICQTRACSTIYQ